MASREEIEKRYEQFRCLELPGQPRMMHMGTSYLVNDLHKALTAAEKERDQLAEDKRELMEALKSMVDMFDCGDMYNDVRDSARTLLDNIKAREVG